jgi:hypothetical protein
MDALRRDILADMARDCAVPSGVAAEPGAFSRSGDRVTVRLGLITCPRWTFGTNPHCGARYCQTDVYDVSGATYELIESRLE